MFSPEMSDYRNVFDEHGHKLERCLAFGEEAEFYIENGLGREITKEECYEVIQNNIDEGLVIQFGYVRNANIICSCHSDCCGVLMTYRNVPDEVWDSSPIKFNCSDYTLEYDRDSCIQCGACVARCPMVSISMDDDGYPTVDNRCVRCGQCGLVCPAGARDSCIQCGACVARCPMVSISMDDDGYPTVDNRCVRCGQCGLVCPAGARKLEHKPAEECMPVPESHMADMNRKFGYRLEHGLV